MWNENEPLELLKDMPTQLNEQNLSLIQEAIDKDKYLNSEGLDYDLCGEYAPFCHGCDKWVKYPCANSYIKMKQAQGMQVEIVREEVAVTEEEPQEETKPRRIRIAIARRK